MKILLLADREEKALWDGWSDEMKQRLSDVGLILSAGDLSAPYLEFLVTMLNVPLVYVRGNHDSGYDDRPPEGCIDADGQIVEEAGLRILGLGGSMRYKDFAKDMYTEDEMRKRILKVSRKLRRNSLMGKKGFDIMLTHAPCRGYGDMDDLPHTGFECFNGLLVKYRPKLHVFGHVHSEYGGFQRKIMHPSSTVLINASGYYLLDL